MKIIYHKILYVIMIQVQKILMPFSDQMDDKYSKNMYACSGEEIAFHSEYRIIPCTLCKFLLYQQ